MLIRKPFLCSLSLFLFLLSFSTLKGQHQTISQPDRPVGKAKNAFDEFSKGQERSVEELYGDSVLEKLKAMTPKAYHDHPEFGKLPHNTQCDSCMELIHERTASKRRFVHIRSEERIFVQRSNGELHYENDEGRWISIDSYLEPQQGSDLLAAEDQPVSVRIDPEGYSTLGIEGFEFRFNKDITLHTYSNSGQMQKLGNISFGETDKGSDGVYTEEVFSDIDRKQIVDLSEIKTNYILRSEPSLAPNTKALVFQDAFELPSGYELVYDSNSTHTSYNGHWVGDLIVKAPNGDEMVRWERATVYDKDRQHFNPASYKIEQNGNEWKVQVLVDADWLLDTAVYPVTVDPLVTGSNTYSAGRIGFSQFEDDGSGICGNSLDYCAASMTVNVPGQSDIQDVIWELEYETKNTTLCGGFFSQHQCVLEHGMFQVVGPCGTSPNGGGAWNCTCPFPDECCCSGTCTGGPVSEPFLANCEGPQCSDYNLNFELRTIHCLNCFSCGSGLSCTTFDCQDYCHYIPDNSWTITVEARTVEGNLLGNGNSSSFTATCVDTPVTLEANPGFGVSSYNCEWSKNGNFVFSNSCNTTVYPTQGAWNTYIVTITDNCGNTYVDSIDVFGDCSGVLPVEFLSFDGKQVPRGVELNWATGTESNSDHFRVMRRSGGKKAFQPIGKVEAAGTSVERREYSFLDPYPTKGTNYYRLRQVDKDGAIKMSSMIAVEFEGRGFEVYPLPARHELHISFKNGPRSSRKIRLYDVTGRPVRSYDLGSVSLSNGEYTLSLRGVSSGIYFLVHQGTEKKISVR